MIVRVDTLDHLITDTALYLGKDRKTLLQDIEGIDFRLGDPAGYRYIADNRKEQLGEVYLCHIARKLDTDSNMCLLPLIDVLRTTNPFSDFLKDHSISFDKSHQNSVELLYHGKKVAWRESRNTYFNPARFQKRLCEDFCINGFQFLYDIVNSAQPGFNLYSRAPEILQDLDYFLNAGLVNDFRSISHTFVALCRIPMDRVFFERDAGDRSFEERYIYSALWYIWEYCYSKVRQGYNYMLYCPDDYTVRVEKWIPEDKIKQQPQPY